MTLTQDNGDDAPAQDAANTPSTRASPSLADLTIRAKSLLAELETFKLHLREIRQESTVEMASFRGTVQSELGMLNRLCERPDSEATSHIARSSNLPFLESVWNTVKRSRNVVALQKRIYFDLPGLSPKPVPTGKNGQPRGKQKRLKSSSTVVDAITDGGRSWTKVSLLTNNRLIHDLARQGWDSGGSDSEIEDESSPDDRRDEEFDVPLVKTAKELAIAAQSTRIRTKHPIVSILLPRIKVGEQNEIDVIIDTCRKTGINVVCGEDVPPAPGINHDILHRMAVDPFSELSTTLNVDCTLLLALVSEFSHATVSKEPWFHTALQRQVEIEGNENLLPSLLYPAIESRKLVSTKEAVDRMREIVATIGTPSEKARSAIMMGDDSTKTPEQLVAEMQEWSAYEVPTTWRLPIRIVDQDEDGFQSHLAAEAVDVMRQHTEINKSVFLYGWANDIHTITSNRTVVKQIETALSAYEDLDDAVWPRIWLCPTARSLVGKEKRGAKKEGNKEGAWPLPDSLRREQQRRHGLDVLSIREGHEVEDLRPNGYDYSDVIAAKIASEKEPRNAS